MSVGYIAQWLERLTADQQVPGSNPGVPSCFGVCDIVIARRCRSVEFGAIWVLCTPLSLLPFSESKPSLSACASTRAPPPPPILPFGGEGEGEEGPAKRGKPEFAQGACPRCSVSPETWLGVARKAKGGVVGDVDLDDRIKLMRHREERNVTKCPHQESNLGCRGHNATS